MWNDTDTETFVIDPWPSWLLIGLSFGGDRESRAVPSYSGMDSHSALASWNQAPGVRSQPSGRSLVLRRLRLNRPVRQKCGDEPGTRTGDAKRAGRPDQSYAPGAKAETRRPWSDVGRRDHAARSEHRSFLQTQFCVDCRVGAVRWLCHVVRYSGCTPFTLRTVAGTRS